MHQTHAMAQVEATQQSASSWLAGYPFKLLHLNAVVGHAGDVPVVVAVGMERLSKQSHRGTLAATLWQSRSPR